MLCANGGGGGGGDGGWFDTMHGLLYFLHAPLFSFIPASEWRSWVDGPIGLRLDPGRC